MNSLELLDRKYFDSDKQYNNYLITYKANNVEHDGFDPLGIGYVKDIWDLINLFIKEKSCSDDVVKTSPDYKKFSGAQVEYAVCYYKQLMNEGAE